jgi:hypothetical protein
MGKDPKFRAMYAIARGIKRSAGTDLDQANGYSSRV